MSDGTSFVTLLASPEAWPIALSLAVIGALTVLAVRERPRTPSRDVR